MADGTMHAEMTLGTGGFTAPLSAAKGAFESVAEVFSKHILGIGAATMTAAGMFEGFKSVIDKGAELKKTSEQIGQSAEDTVRLQRAWKQAGEETDGIGNKINMLQAALSGVSETGEKTADTFAAMGLNMQELRGMSAAKQLEAIGEAFEKITSQEDRIKVMRNLFGRGGGEMMGVMEQTKGMSDPLSARAQILAASATTFKKTAILLRDAGSVVQSFFVGVAEKVAPVLNPLLERFNKLDFSKWGEQIGNVAVVIDQAFATGKYKELFALALKVGAMEAINLLVQGMSVISSMIMAMGPAIITAFSLLQDPEFLGGIGDMMVAAVGGLSVALLTAFKEPLSYLSAAIDTIAKAFADGLVWAWNKLAETSIGKKLGMNQLESKGPNDFEAHRQSFLNDWDKAVPRLTGATVSSAQEGTAELGQALSPLGDSLMKAFNQVLDGAKKSGSINFFGPELENLKGQLGTMVAGLLEDGKKLEANKAPGAPGADTDPGSALKAVEGDRLAKIGGFVGGSYSGSNDFSRRTADNTAKLVQKQDVLISRVESLANNTTGFA